MQADKKAFVYSRSLRQAQQTAKALSVITWTPLKMKISTVIFFIFFCSNLKSQTRILDKISVGDTLLIQYGRIACRLGEYDRDTLKLTRNQTEYFVYSYDKRIWFKTNEDFLTKLQNMEKKGLKKVYSGTTVDVYFLKMNGKTSSFQLDPKYYNDLILPLKTAYLNNNKRQLE